MAVWVVRTLEGQDPPTVGKPRFDDIDADSFYAPFIERMAEMGITSGCGDGTRFCPDQHVTRAQMAVFLSRAYGLAAESDPGFADVAPDAWYRHEVAGLAAFGDYSRVRGWHAVLSGSGCNSRRDGHVPVEG